MAAGGATEGPEEGGATGGGAAGRAGVRGGAQVAGESWAGAGEVRALRRARASHGVLKN